MYKLLTAAFLITLSFSGTAQGLSWAKSLSSQDNIITRMMTTDNNGDILVLGQFSGTADFDPSPASANFTALGFFDTFFAKYDSSGNYLWAKQIMCTYSVWSFTLAVDAAGDIYLAGYFEFTADFDPSPAINNITSAGYADIFLAKYDGSGNYLWAKSMASQGNEQCSGMVMDDSSNIYLTGSFTGTTDLDPSSNNYPLTSSGNRDVFLAKYNMNGDFEWAGKIGGSVYDESGSLATDADGNIYVTGSFGGTVDFDFSADTANISAGGNLDTYVARYSAQGQLSWVRSISSSTAVQGKAISLSSQGDVYVAGGYYTTTDFNPSGSANILSSQGDMDAFVAKYDTSGNLAWANGIGSVGLDIARSISVDGSGNCYLAGTYEGILSYTSTGIGLPAMNAQGRDLFLARYNPAGQHTWAFNISGPGTDEAGDIMLDGQGNLYYMGYFEDSIDLDPTGNVSQLVSAGFSNGFLAKYVACTPSSGTIVATACDSIVSPSGTKLWTTSGIYTDTILNAEGCDSILTVDATVYHSTDSTQTVTACDSFYWDVSQQTYTSGGVYTAAYTAINGCDSLVSLNLKLGRPDSLHESFTSCGAYTWPANNTTYTSGGDYVVNLSDTSGCDSIVTLNLTIDTVDAEAARSGDSLIATAVGADYQWVDCGNNYSLLPGDTASFFVPTANGSYAVIVTAGACTDTSSCISIDDMGSMEIAHAGLISVYPNPTSGKVHFETNNLPIREIRIFDQLGRAVMVGNGVDQLDLTHFPDGIYFVSVDTGEEVIQTKLVKRFGQH